MIKPFGAVQTIRAACNSIHGWLRVHPNNQALLLADSCARVCGFMASYAYFTALCKVVLKMKTHTHCLKTSIPSYLRDHTPEG